MARKIVGILRGGTSSEYPLSLKTGAAMLSALPEEKYDTRDIFIDKTGLWHSRGIPVDPARILAQIDVALNALHGGVGEDGTVQRLLELAGVPYAGARPLPSALSLNKHLTIQTLRDAGVLVPRSAAFSVQSDMTTAQMARRIFSEFGPPYIVKPVSDGASHGIGIAFTIVELPDVLGDVLDKFGAALVQEFVRGDEASVGIIENFRDQELYALPPAQTMLPEGSRYFERAHHEENTARHIVPSNFDHADKLRLEEAARDAHQTLGLSHFSRADFILSRGKPYLLEVNAIPGLYPGAVFPQMLEAVGSSSREFLEHAVRLARV